MKCNIGIAEPRQDWDTDILYIYINVPTKVLSLLLHSNFLVFGMQYMYMYIWYMKCTLHILVQCTRNIYDLW